MELLAFVVLVLGLVGSSILRRHLILARQLRLRQIIHEERMRAMERNVEPPEADDVALVRALGDTRGPRPNGKGWLFSSVLWVRLVCLCLGLTAFFGGVGTCIGLAISTGEPFQYWPLGLIPAFIGVGLLIFYAMSASLVAQARQEAAASVG